MTSTIHNAIISSTTLTIQRGFILDSWVHCDYGVCGQGFGGFALYLSKTATHHQMLTVAGHWIYRVMEVAGVEDWDRLRGRAIRVRVTDDRIEAIGHIIKDDWFFPAVDFAKANAEVSK